MLYYLNVGKDFIFGFFKKNKNCCYDKEKGLLYTNDIENFKKLKLNVDFVNQIVLDKQNNENLQDKQYVNIKDVIPLFLEKVSLFEQHKEEISKKFFSFSEEFKVLQNKNNFAENSIKDLLEIEKENQELEEQRKQCSDETIKILKNSISLLNKKIKSNNEEILNLQDKFEAILEILSEQKASQMNLPDITSLSKMSLEKIWNISSNKDTAALFSLVLMCKKMLEEKGMRL